VHPSWRDLVIDALAADPAARRHFLERCGVHGIVLAVSVGGGASGARQLPLLGDDRDWDALADRIYALAPELEPAELSALLGALRAAVEEVGGAAAGIELRALARTTLERVAGSWNDARAPIGLLLLDAWLTLAGRLDPPPALPSLAVTWAELLPTHLPTPGDRVESERFADWLELCRLLWSGHPEAWETLHFGPAHVHLIADFVDAVGRRTPAPGDEPSADAEPVRRALEAIGVLLPQLQARATQLHRWLAVDTGGGASDVAFEPDLNLDPSGDDVVITVQRVLEDL
jgi:hypothetical protein